MKLAIKAIILLTVLFIVSSRENDKEKKINKLRANIPARGFRVLPSYTKYFRSGHLFKGVPVPYRKTTPGVAEIANRSCFTLCKDRIIANCPRGIESRPDKWGMLECICKKKYKRNRKIFPQEDQCFSLDGCFPKPIGMSCLK